MRCMWKEHTANMMLSNPRVPIDLKAYILFYRYILWPDKVRGFYNTMREGGVNEHFEDVNLQWNLYPCPHKIKKKWFPTIERNGKCCDLYEDSNIIRACLTELVKTFFKKSKIMVKRKKYMGLGWFDDGNNSDQSLVTMKDDVAGITKGFYI